MLIKKVPKENYSCLLAMLIVFVPKALMILPMMPVRTVSDEVATVSGAAYAAGYDWSAVVSHAGYYGQGFYILFWWVFRLTDNPIVIQHTILYICAALQFLIAPIVFHIAQNHFHLKNGMTVFLLAVLAGYLPVTRVLVLYNENILNLYVWIIVAVWMEAIDADGRMINFISGKAGKALKERASAEPPSTEPISAGKKAGWSVLLCVLLGWGITIHLRMWAMVIAFLVMEVVYWICCKGKEKAKDDRKREKIGPVSCEEESDIAGAKKESRIGSRKKHSVIDGAREDRIGEPSCGNWKDLFYLILLGLVILAGSVFIHYEQNHLWALQAGKTLRNASVVLKAAADWGNSTYFKAFFGIVFGQINTYQVFSCGMGLLGVILIVVFLKKSGDPVLRRKVILIGGTLFLSILGTIFAQAADWGAGVSRAMAAGRMDGVYSYKAFTYIRYFGIYAGALTVLGLMCGFCLAEEALGVEEKSDVCQNSRKKIDSNVVNKPIARKNKRKSRNSLLTKETCYRDTPCMILAVDGLFLMFLQIIWFAVPQKYLGNNWYAREPFIFFAQWYRGKTYSRSPYLYGIAFLIAFFVLTVLLCRRKKYNILVGAAAGVLMAEYIFTGVYFDFADSRYEYNKVNDSWKYLSRIAEEKTIQGKTGSGETGAKEKEVYCCDLTGRNDHNSWYLLQFYLPDWKIIPIKENEIIMSGIVQANSPDYDPTGGGDVPYERLVLDSYYGKYIYLGGKDAITEYGGVKLHTK